MKLYHNPASPFVRKVRVVASECGVANQIALEEIALTPVSPHSGLVDDNPLGKIPALVVDGNQCLYDSRVICEFLDTKFSGGLFPSAMEDRIRALRWQAVADGLCDAAVLVRYEGFVRPESKQWSEWIEGQLDKCRQAIDHLELECQKTSNKFSGVIDIGTLSIAVALAYFEFRNSDEQWMQRAPVLASWYQQFSKRPSLTATQPV